MENRRQLSQARDPEAVHPGGPRGLPMAPPTSPRGYPQGSASRSDGPGAAPSGKPSLGSGGGGGRASHGLRARLERLCPQPTRSLTCAQEGLAAPVAAGPPGGLGELVGRHLVENASDAAVASAPPPRGASLGFPTHRGRTWAVQHQGPAETGGSPSAQPRGLLSGASVPHRLPAQGVAPPPNPPTRLGPWEPPKVQQGTHLPLQTSTPLGHKHPGPGHLHDGSPCGCRPRPPPSTSSPGCCPGANPWLQDSRAAGSASSTARSSSSTHCAESQALALGGDSPTDPTQASCFREGLELPQGQGLAEAWAPRGQPGQEGRCGATRL